MYRNRINLVTFSDIKEFINITTSLEGKIFLKDDDDFCVNAKSILGALTSLEWKRLYCVSEKDISAQIQKFII